MDSARLEWVREPCQLFVKKVLQIWEARVVRSVWRGKTGRPKREKSIHSFAISSDLCSHLARRRQHQEDSCLVFSTRNGTPWDEGLLVKRKLHPLLDRLGIARAGLGFRHGNSSFMDQHNTPTAVRLNRLGHADVRMMANYSHPSRPERSTQWLSLPRGCAGSHPVPSPASPACRSPSRRRRRRPIPLSRCRRRWHTS